MNSLMCDDVGAVILCGGQSRRMGSAKAWLPFGDEVLLQRVVRLVSQNVIEIVVVAAHDQDVPALPSAVKIVRDSVSDRGPLQGLAAGFAALSNQSVFVFASATDVPFLAPMWIPFLREKIGDHSLVIPFSQGYHHPLAALYRPSVVAPAIERLLREDRLRPFFLIEAVKTIEVCEDELRRLDPDLKTLQNLNTPDDYARALEQP